MFAHQGFWHKNWPDLTLKYEPVVETVGDPKVWCGTGEGTIACAMRNLTDDRPSEILVTPDYRYNKCVLRHEFWHLKGYDHPNFDYSSPSCQDPPESTPQDIQQADDWTRRNDHETMH